jgi:hypothetical protein
VNAAIGPLFAGPPGAHGIPWLHVLPILVAVPAVALLLWGCCADGSPQVSLDFGIVGQGF